MARPPILSLILAAVLGLAACGGDSHEAVAKESIEKMQEFGDTLAKITDKPSAEAHKAELETLVADMKDIQARMEKMEDPSPEKEAELQAQFEKQMQPAVEKMSREMMRLAQLPDVMPVIQPVLEKMQG